MTARRRRRRDEDDRDEERGRRSPLLYVLLGGCLLLGFGIVGFCLFTGLAANELSKLDFVDDLDELILLAPAERKTELVAGRHALMRHHEAGTLSNRSFIALQLDAVLDDGLVTTAEAEAIGRVFDAFVAGNGDVEHRERKTLRSLVERSVRIPPGQPLEPPPGERPEPDER